MSRPGAGGPPSDDAGDDPDDRDDGSREAEDEDADADGGEGVHEDEDDGELGVELDAGRWPLNWSGLYPHERWLWFEQLWSDARMLRERYRLAIRSGWWEDQIQVETLAAVAAWVERYDSGEWDDPPGKLALLCDLERVGGLLRDGLHPWHPERDRPAFVRHLIELGCRPPDLGTPVDGD